jgi:hypothetical protein
VWKHHIKNAQRRRNVYFIGLQKMRLKLQSDSAAALILTGTRNAPLRQKRRKARQQTNVTPALWRTVGRFKRRNCRITKKSRNKEIELRDGAFQKQKPNTDTNVGSGRSKQERKRGER